MNFIIIGDKPTRGAKTKGWIGAREINKKYTLACNQISSINKFAPSAKIIYVYGFDSKRTENYFAQKKKLNVIPIYNENYSVYGELYSISKAKRYLDEDTIIISGSLELSKSFFTKLDKTRNSIFINEKQDCKSLGCTINEKNHIEYISYDLRHPVCGIYYIKKNSMQKLKAIALEIKWRNFFLFEIINKMIESDVEFYPHIIQTRKIGKE